MLSMSPAWRRALTICLAIFYWSGYATAGTVRIGQSLPDTPESYLISSAIAYATDALVSAVNARGGIHGERIELLTLRDDGTPEGYARNVERLLKDDGVVAIVNCVGDRPCREGQRVVAERGALLVGTMSGAKILRMSSDHVFPIRADYEAEAYVLARQLATIGVTSAAVLSDEQSMPEKRQALLDALKANGVSANVVEVAANRSSLEVALGSLEKIGPNALLLDLGARTLSLTGDLIKKRPFVLPSVIASFADPELSLSIPLFRGKTFGFTSVVPNPESETSQLAFEFRQDLAGAPLGITYAGMEAYLNLRVVLDVLEQAGKAPTSAKLQRVFSETDIVKVGELDVIPSVQSSPRDARVGLGVISARGIVLE